MIKRTIYNDLLKWKLNKHKKPLILRGARQVGKSFIINEFGRKNYKNLITINFERDPEFKTAFETFKPKEIIEKIELLTAEKINEESTLIFLDEIQDCPESILALRYFYEEMPKINIIGAGSSLEFALKKGEIKTPVGRIQYLYMYPLSFVEFVESLEGEKLANYIQNFENIKNVPDAIHNKLLEILKKYMIVGGMPEVVSRYKENKDFFECRELQSSIIDTYNEDFRKYVSPTKYKYLSKVFTESVKIVGKKYVYSNIDSEIKSRDLKEAVELLETIGVLYRITKTNGEGLPLQANSKNKFFKVVYVDTGLFSNLSGIDNSIKESKSLSSLFKGAISEQFAGQEIIVNQANYTKPSVHYWFREKKGSTAEIDYLIQNNNEIIPVEVKAGKTGMMKSMNIFNKRYNTSGLLISKKQYNYDDKLKITSIPFYGINAFLNNKIS